MSKTPMKKYGEDGLSFIREPSGREVLDILIDNKDGKTLLRCNRIVAISTTKPSGVDIHYMGMDHQMKVLSCSKRLADLEPQLPDLIIRCHQSHMVNACAEWVWVDADRICCHLLPGLHIGVRAPGIGRLLSDMVKLRTRWDCPFG